MQRSVHVSYYKREETDFHNKGVMWRFLNDVAARGYHLPAFSELDEAFITWRETTTEQPYLPFTPEGAATHITPDNLSSTGISATVYDEMATFVKEKRNVFGVSAFPTARSGPLSDFKLMISFRAAACSISISLMTNAFVANKVESTQVFDHWLDLFQLMYRTWHPVYGHSLSVDADWPGLSEDAIQTYCVPYLYEINFLGPEFVEKLGRKRVLSTPAWKVQQLDDGGVLIVPEFIFGPKDPAAWQASTQHLGMEQYFRGRYARNA